ncbi:MAG: hypothetical protein R2795_08900 [Saprospiraceae bacterium]
MPSISLWTEVLLRPLAVEKEYVVEVMVSGELAYTCWGNIFAEDKTAPVIESCPANINAHPTLYTVVESFSGELDADDPYLQ